VIWNRVFRWALLPLVAVCLVGCGDDDCPNCPRTSTQKMVVFGLVQAYDCGVEPGLAELYASGSIYGIAGPVPEIDSVLVQGRRADLTDYPLQEETWFYLPWSETQELDSLSAGDSVTVKVYAPCGVSSAKIETLGYCSDAIGIIGWSTDYYDYDSVQTQSTIIVDWHPVSDADWYVVYAFYEYDSLGNSEYVSSTEFAPDTTFVIPSSETRFDGWYDIGVYALTGPNPSSAAGNFVGGCARGIVNSVLGEFIRVKIGAGTSSLAGLPGQERGGSVRDRRQADVQECLQFLKNSAWRSLPEE